MRPHAAIWSSWCTALAGAPRGLFAKPFTSWRHRVRCPASPDWVSFLRGFLTLAPIGSTLRTLAVDAGPSGLGRGRCPAGPERAAPPRLRECPGPNRSPSGDLRSGNRRGLLSDPPPAGRTGSHPAERRERRLSDPRPASQLRLRPAASDEKVPRTPKWILPMRSCSIWRQSYRPRTSSPWIEILPCTGEEPTGPSIQLFRSRKATRIPSTRSRQRGHQIVPDIRPQYPLTSPRSIVPMPESAPSCPSATGSARRL
jgi:hypothetical protein